MTNVEVVFLIFVLVFAIVGVVRGFLRELGVTIVMIATLFALDRLIPLVEQLIRGGSLQALGWQPYVGNAPTEPSTRTALTVIFGLLTLAATFVAYQGETLAFEGKSPAFPVGLKLLKACLGIPPLLVAVQNLVHGLRKVRITRHQALFHIVRIVADEPNIEHPAIVGMGLG